MAIKCWIFSVPAAMPIQARRYDTNPGISILIAKTSFLKPLRWLGSSKRELEAECGQHRQPGPRLGNALCRLDGVCQRD